MQMFSENPVPPDFSFSLSLTETWPTEHKQGIMSGFRHIICNSTPRSTVDGINKSDPHGMKYRGVGSEIEHLVFGG